MQNNLIDKQLVDTTMAQCGVSNLDDASIRDTVKIANLLEKATGEKFIRMEMGAVSYTHLVCRLCFGLSD